jgi:anthranilate synthase component 2
MHGKTDAVRHDGTGLFAGLPSPLTATRYHSLVVAREGLPQALRVTAETDDGAIMGLAHRTLPLHGVQFHPESIASEHGHAMLRNFLALCAVPA